MPPGRSSCCARCQVCADSSRHASTPKRGRYVAGEHELSQTKLGLDPGVVAAAREMAARAGQPVVALARRHTTVSVERAVLRLGGLTGADPEGIPWVNRLVDAVRHGVGLEQGVALPVWHAAATSGLDLSG